MGTGANIWTPKRRGKPRLRRPPRARGKRTLRPAFGPLVPAIFTIVVAAIWYTCSHRRLEFEERSSSDRASDGSGDEYANIVRVDESSVLRKYPHDPHAFTQGLVLVSDMDTTTEDERDTNTHEKSRSMRRGRIFESTGLYGKSTLREIEVETGDVIRTFQMNASDFGEGLCKISVPNESGTSFLVQLTWKERKGYVYDAQTFERIRTFRYETTPPGHEGWGITGNGTHLFVSDGTATIFVWDARTFEEVDRFVVHERDPKSAQPSTRPVTRLNELEWVRSEILANVWYEDRIIRIDPTRIPGRVLGEYDCAPLARPYREKNSHAVLNGIAYDESDDTLLVTGKLWSAMYRIQRAQ